MGTPAATPKRAGVVDAQKKAEDLFQTKNIAEIREIEAQTRKDIEGKKKQLRQLVGDSYRDLIESADKIVSIAKSCDSILSNVISIQDGFSSLTANVSSSFKAPVGKARSLKNHEVLYAVGSRMKYLLDTPEMIWGCLDSQQYIQAARRYVRAQEVYRLLKENFSPELLAKFPLLGHQWPQVKKFRDQILEGVHTRLSSNVQLSSRQVSDTVVAAMMLSESSSNSSSAALQLFLSARRQWLQTQLRGAEAEAVGVEHVAGVLARVAAGLMDTISQVGDVFLWTNRTSEPSCLLAQAAREDETQMTELIFRGVHGSDDSQSPEMDAWCCFNQLLLEQLAPVPNSQAEQACSEFTAGVGKDIASACQGILLPCSEAAGLCRVEAAIRSALSEWKPPAKPPPTAQSAAEGAAAPTGWRGKVESETWEMVCEFVLGRPLPIWQDLFHGPFTAHAKLLIQRKFALIRRSIEDPLDDCLAQVALGDTAPVGAVRLPSWPQAAAPSSSSLLGDASVHSSPTKRALMLYRTTSQQEWITGSNTGSRSAAHHLLQQLEQQLQQTLSDCILLLGDSATSAYASHLRTSSHYSAIARSSGVDTPLRSQLSGAHLPITTPLSFGSSRKDSAARVAELEPFIQQKSAEMATALAALLQSRVDALPSPDPSDKGAAVVEQLLLLAQLCSALGGDSAFLQMTAGGLDGWKGSSISSFTNAARSASSFARSLRPGSLGGLGGKQQQLAEAFRNVGLKCYRLWSHWAATGLSQQLFRALQANDLLSTNTTPSAWEETVVSPTSDPDTALELSEDMRFYLPACPSPEVMSMLIGACAEVSRAGDYAIDSEALQVLQWEVMGTVIQVYGKLLLPPPVNKRKVSEKGVLQLLLDVRFLRDVLAAGRPAIPARSALGSTPAPMSDVSAPDITSSLSERKRDLQSLESSLQDMLDPIDWATYEPYLNSNATRYLQRCSAVLGMLTHAQRGSTTLTPSPAESAGTAGRAHEFNPLNVMPVAPRFQYLPISTPTSHGAGGAGAKGRVLPGAGLPGLQWISGVADNPSETFSFSTLSTSGSSSMSTAGMAELNSLDAAGGSSSTLGALHAKLQAGTLGTFSSLLGDKAAEMTAIAQQRLETMGLHDLGQGLLSSITKGVVQSGYARVR